MHEKKSQEKTGPLPEIQSSVTEVLVANGRSFQPFIRTFSYVGENVTKQSLGTLIGVFEIDDQSEDSAYIVNFLASVAKKEYWSNPRRGAIESFEAALHKINLALAELVKHGNIAWLGKLHGAIGVLEKNNLHFSVTGQAKILLLRNGTFADLSEGLASDESHLHPIKTFVEISSGRLSAGDQILTASPELLALFSIEELTRNAARMNNEQFTQFLKTALVNELDMAGLMVIDVRESHTPERSQDEKKPVNESVATRVNNVFSQSAFKPKKPSDAPSVHDVLVSEQQEKESDYTDSKTGHIYVQGDTPQMTPNHPWLEELELKLQELPRIFHSFAVLQGKWWRKTKKHVGLITESSLKEGQAIKRKFGRALRRQWRKIEAARAQKKAAQAEEVRLQEMSRPLPPVTVADIPVPVRKTPPIQVTIPETDTVSPPIENILSPEPVPEDELPAFMKEKLAQFYGKEKESPRSIQVSGESQTELVVQTPVTISFGTRFREVLQSGQVWITTLQTLWGKIVIQETIRNWVSETLMPCCQTIWTRFQALTRRTKIITLSVLGITVCGGFAFLLFRPSPPAQESAPNPTASAPITSPAYSDTSAQNGDLSQILNTSENILTSVILGNQAYVLTTRSIIAVTENKTFPLPSGATASYAAAMDDLRLIFVSTENGKLYAWSPIAKTFVENTLSLPEGARIAGIDTYLTYLYVLDRGTNQVYRFPRAEGGFGAGTPWLKDSVSLEASARLAVNENLFIAQNDSVLKGYFRGRTASTLTSSESFRVTDLYTHPGLANIYVLDSEHGKIFIWNQNGQFVKVLSDEKLTEGKSLSVNEKEDELFIGTDHTLLSFKLK